MILLIDNYDSFVFNLARYVRELGFTTNVVRNDAIGIAKIQSLQPSHIIISPGPCTPDEAGISMDVIKKLGASIPILGVCLGHQAIAQAYGGKVIRAQQPMHGKASDITHTGKGLFAGLENPLTVGRYHSLIACEDTLPHTLKVTARSELGEIMAFEHIRHPVFGVQFHPESIMTVEGHAILRHFLNTIII